MSQRILEEKLKINESIIERMKCDKLQLQD